MLDALLIILHVFVSLFLILVVLLQTGKGADLAGAFGGGGSQTAFGSRGAATFLSKMTTASAVIFMATSFTLAIRSASGTASVLDETGVPQQPAAATAPATAGDGEPVEETGFLPPIDPDSATTPDATGGTDVEESDTTGDGASGPNTAPAGDQTTTDGEPSAPGQDDAVNPDGSPDE